MKIQELAKDQIVRVWVDGLSVSRYEDGIIRMIDYDNDEIHVELFNSSRIVSFADVEVPR